MPWDSKGDARCDTCGFWRCGHWDKAIAIQMLRAAGWHHMEGSTLGGQPFEHILCALCGREEHKRPRTAGGIEQEQLPLDWEGEQGGRRQGKGIQSR